MEASWVIFLKPPLILDGHMLNDIWTIVQNHVCKLWRSPLRAPYEKMTAH